MTSQDVRVDIARLESVRRQTQFWRVGYSLALLATTLVSLGMIRNSINGLLQSGPTQDQFTATLSKNLQHDVVPQVQDLAKRTLTEMRPEVQTAFTKLNERVPELSQAAAKEFDTLQTNVPQKGQKALEDTFGKLIESKGDELKKQFPGATDENIKAMTTNVSDVAAEQIVHSRDTLFSKHLSSLNSIMGNLQVIQSSEKAPATGQVADWDLVSAVLDMAHHDMNNLTAGGNSSSASKKTSASQPASAAKAKTS